LLLRPRGFALGLASPTLGLLADAGGLSVVLLVRAGVVDPAPTNIGAWHGNGTDRAISHEAPTMKRHTLAEGVHGGDLNESRDANDWSGVVSWFLGVDKPQVS
jgi:hypothetical protein